MKLPNNSKEITIIFIMVIAIIITASALLYTIDLFTSKLNSL